jgi:hypothetical protein
MKRLSKFLICLTVGISLLVPTLSASAAASWPRFSSSKPLKAYTISSSNNTPAYSDENLTKRKGTIYSTDELWITSIKMNKKGTWIAIASYPVTGGRKTAIIPLSVITTATAPTEQGVAQTSLTTFRRAGSSTKAGSISKNDKVWNLGTSGKYTQVMYNIGSVSSPSGYRIAWISTANYNKYVKVSGNSGSSGSKTTTSSVEASVQNRLDQILNGSIKYDAGTTMTLNSTFKGTRETEQCKGYAKNTFYMVFNVLPGSTQNKPNNYLLNTTSGMKLVGSVTKMNQADIKNLFQKGRAGDFVQIRRNHTGSHSAIVYSVSSSGVTLMEANVDGKNTIIKKTYTWKDLCNSNAAMSVYTATNYKLK